MARHSWSDKNTSGLKLWPGEKAQRCTKCGVVKITSGKGKQTQALYRKGNKNVGTGPLGYNVPECDG